VPVDRSIALVREQVHLQYLTENVGVENAAPSSGAYSGFQARVCEVRTSGDEIPPVESRGKAPVRSLGTTPRSSSLFVYESIFFYTRDSTENYAGGGIAIAELSVRLSVHLSVTLRYCIKTNKVRVMIS